EELGELCRELTPGKVQPATAKLAKALVDESRLIKELRSEGWLASDIEKEASLRQRLPSSIKLMEALNRRRNYAIQSVLGVSADSLKKLFRQVREALAPRKQRLVLLLEDITSWEGIDEALIDVLVTNASTRSEADQADMCPLISVVGVTPAFYLKLPG